jgi:hypothetical protein
LVEGREAAKRDALLRTFSIYGWRKVSSSVSSTSPEVLTGLGPAWNMLAGRIVDDPGGSMSELLKGNFTTKNPVSDQVEKPSLEDQFEMAALKRLGGSITFVAKRKVMWDLAGGTDGRKRK